MGKILVTGASGLIGTALCNSLATEHEVVALSRRKPSVDGTWVRGDFASFEDLSRVHREAGLVDAVVHLGAVTGGCKESECLSVNVIGSRNLLRWGIDTGCRTFVLASSIAAVGMQRPDFQPVSLPMSDTHPCLDRDGYGFSKYLMEEVAKYHVRQEADIDVIALRLASISRDDALPPKASADSFTPGESPAWGAGRLTIMALSDAVEAFRKAVEAPHRPGMRILNAAAPWAWTTDPVADLLTVWWGDSVDLSHYRQPGHEYDSLYDVSAIERKIGFRASVR